MRLHHKLPLTWILLFTFMLTVTGAAYAVPNLPNLPQSFYGNITNSTGNVNGGVIEGILDEKVFNLSFSGATYGGSGGLTDKTMDVFGESLNHTVSFRVNGVPANQTVIYKPGEITRLDLTIPYNVNDLAVSPAAINLKPGEKTTMTVIAKYSNGTSGSPVASGLTFVSGNNNVVTVNSTGEVTGVSSGSSNITVNYYGLTKTVTVTIADGSHGGGSGGGGGGSTLPVPPVAGPLVSPFSDVPNDYWAVNEIVYLYSNGIISGFPDGTFRPQENVTRAQLSVMVAKVLKLDTGSVEGNGSFTDVTAQHWAFKQVEAMAKAKIMMGYNGKFRPEDPVIREELVQVIINALHYGEENESQSSQDILNRFKDADDIPPWARDAVAEAVELGLVNGIETDQFGAGTNGSRDQVAVLVYKLLKLLEVK